MTQTEASQTPQAAEIAGYIMAYTKTGGDPALDQSLHLAWSETGRRFEPLNADSGVCFASQKTGEHTIECPWLLRLKDHSYALLALSTSRPGILAVYPSQDLVVFGQETLLDLGIGLEPEHLQCWYDPAADRYDILWSDGMKQYRQTTSDFISLTPPEETRYEIWLDHMDRGLEDAVPGNILPVDKRTLMTVKARLLPVRNTGIERLPQTLEITRGEALVLPEGVRAFYSDGSMSELPVDWDLSGFRPETPGEYLVRGKLGPVEYPNPFIESKADPWIFRDDDGQYYFTASYPMFGADDQEGYSRVTLRRASTIGGLQQAEEVTIWQSGGADGIYRFIWAPEIHRINGRWYVFFTGSTSPGDVFAIRPHLLSCREGTDPMNPANWQAEGRMLALDGDDLSFRTFSLDMTTFEAGGRHYVVWAEKTTGDSVLYIATVDPANPRQLTSRPMLLTEPEFGWEQVRHRVNEGPAVLKRNGRVFLCYSAAGTGPEYCMGLLIADETADLLDPAAWTKNPYPILTTADVAGEYGPGHNSFTTDADGRDIFVYHARSEECYRGECEWAGQDPLFDPCRHARIKPVHWGSGDMPILKMTADQFVAPEHRLIEIRIRVS